MFNDKKLCFIDLETTGLEPGRYVILSIGAVTSDDKEYYAVIKPTLEQWACASPEALVINGFDWVTLDVEGRKFTEVRDEFCKWLVENGIEQGKSLFVGQNPDFDFKFLKFFMGGYLEYINIPLPPVDVRDIYTTAINKGKLFPTAQFRHGKTISLELGVEPEPEPHNALEGAKVIRRNFEALVKLLEG